MKVIIQELSSKTYLAADGTWVSERGDAGDFQSLLRAYHFARISTTRNFELFLYCPDDGYSASIMTGVGIADLNPPMSPEPVAIRQQVARNNFSAQCHRPRFSSAFDQTNNHLN